MSMSPLAYRMRPKHIDEVVGQQHIVGKETGTYKMIQRGYVPSMLLYGEPGIGKTSIAYAIAGTIDVPFETLNATTSGKKDVEKVVEMAKKIVEKHKKNLENMTEEEQLEEQGKTKFILFIDEIHRFNKLQQDSLLDHMESGVITLIGATTSNPYFEVNPAIRSRCKMVEQLHRLTIEDIVFALERAIEDRENGFGKYKIKIDEEVLKMIGYATNGEVRASLNVLEMAFYSCEKDEDGYFVITKETIQPFTKNKGMNHDKDGDHHYNLLSAFQKSIRGSDVNAALHYLGRLIETGDEKSIIRRLKVIAFEDVGNSAINVVNFVCHACDSVRELGFPEARIPLANAVVALCLSPKSNTAYKALDRALADIRSGNVGEIPMHLRDAHYASANKLGHGVGYLYPHDYPGGWVDQEYLPETLRNRVYYEPKNAGNEKSFKEVYENINKMKEQKKK